MQSSYKPDDVEILLKDITGQVEPLPASEREKKIQSGTHYCEMLPIEYRPSREYMTAYEFALEHYAVSTANAVAKVAELIYCKKGGNVVLVSLARAGIPIGILVKRYIEKKYSCRISHYAISIIRDRGIDRNAMKHILNKHDPKDIQFLDGWVGKGAIFGELYKELACYPDIEKSLAVVSDPANITEMCGTHEDILIPSSCLNAIVTGLISRTFLRSDIIGNDDFHGGAFYSELKGLDLSNDFLEKMEKHFDYSTNAKTEKSNFSGIIAVKQVAQQYKVDNINYIKPGIGEATRVLLRRVPWMIIVNSRYRDSDELKHIYKLADEKKVPVELSTVDLGNYKVCGLIKKISDI